MSLRLGRTGGEVGDWTPEGLRRRLGTYQPQIEDLYRRLSNKVDTFEEEADSGAPRFTGQLLVMSASADSIASGGDYVAFDTIVAREGFLAVSAAGASFTHPLTGVYVLDYEHAWDSYTDGGTIQLEVAGNLIPEGTIGQGSAGQIGRGTIAYHAEQGQAGKIKVAQSSGSAQTCDATVYVAVTGPTGEADQWVKVTDADVYELLHDGTNWWTTQGQNGNTVSKRDDAWAVVSSFQATELDNLGVERVRGVALDGTHLWLSGPATKLAEYDTAGTLQSSFVITGSAHNGVAWDGTDVWVVEGELAEIYRYTTAGSLQQTISLPGGDLYYGLDYFNDHLYVVRDDDLVLVVNRSGTVVGQIDVSGAATGITGVWIESDGTLYVSKDGAGVWRRVEKVG